MVYQQIFLIMDLNGPALRMHLVQPQTEQEVQNFILRLKDLLNHTVNYGTQLHKHLGTIITTMAGTKDGMMIVYLYH